MTRYDRPMVFAEPQPLAGPVVVTVPHDYGGDTNDLRDSLRSAGVTCEVIRAAPPPQHDEHRVTLTSKHATAATVNQWQGPIDADKVAAGCFVLVDGKIGVRAAQKIADEIIVVMLGTGQIETLCGDTQVMWRDA